MLDFFFSYKYNDTQFSCVFEKKKRIKMFIFFLEHAGELHIIILRRKKGYEPLQKPTHIHASSLTQNKRNFINKETTLICAQCLLGTEVRR